MRALAEFRAQSERDLQNRSDEELISYALAAREAENADAERLALEILAFGLEGFVAAVVAEKIPSQDVPDLACDVLEGALKSLRREGARFRGHTLSEFRGWLKRIAVFKRADWLDRQPPPAQPLISEHEGDETVFGTEPATPDFADGVADLDAFDQEMAKLDERKRLVVELRLLDDFSSNDTADRTNQAFPDWNPPMTASNVDQIVSRFRKNLRGDLD